MRKTFIAILAAALLTGCAETRPAKSNGWQEISNDNYVTGVIVETQNGPVTCVVLDGYSAGGITCDWAKQ